MKIERILAGIDLGQDTEKVLAYACLFAGRLGASLHVLYVMDYLVTPPAYIARYMEEEKKIAQKRFKEWEKRLEENGVKASIEVTVGRLHESFDFAVRKVNAGMLVIGFRSHAFRRSSSEKLIKGLRMPMLVVRGRKAESAGIGSLNIRRVLCPVDFSEPSRKALEAAIELKETFSSAMDVVHVFPGRGIDKRMQTLKEKEEAMEELRRQAEVELRTFLRGSGVDRDGITEEGEPHERILSFASEKDADIIVMGARGLSFIKGVLIGSVTDAVLRSSPCPVLVIH